MAVLVDGLSIVLPLSFGICNMIVGIGQLVVGYFTDKKYITFATLISLTCGSFAIDFANYLIPDTSEKTMMYIYMLLGIILYCFGIAIQIIMNCGLGSLDCFIFGLMKAFKTDSYSKIRWISDGAFLLLGFILGGTIGLGTVLYLLVTGKLIEWFVKLLKKYSFQ